MEPEHPVTTIGRLRPVCQLDTNLNPALLENLAGYPVLVDLENHQVGVELLLRPPSLVKNNLVDQGFRNSFCRAAVLEGNRISAPLSYLTVLNRSIGKMNLVQGGNQIPAGPCPVWFFFGGLFCRRFNRLILSPGRIVDP